jgi:hypothetical protein
MMMSMEKEKEFFSLNQIKKFNEKKRRSSQRFNKTNGWFRINSGVNISFNFHSFDLIFFTKRFSV